MGVVRVIDGDTIEIHGERIRPGSMRQRAARNVDAWMARDGYAGQQAALALQDCLGRRPITCDRFFRGEPSRLRNTEGTGLGRLSRRSCSCITDALSFIRLKPAGQNFVRLIFPQLTKADYERARRSPPKASKNADAVANPAPTTNVAVDP